MNEWWRKWAKWKSKDTAGKYDWASADDNDDNENDDEDDEDDDNDDDDYNENDDDDRYSLMR